MRSKQEAVSALLLGKGNVDFEWREPHNDPRDVHAYGFLRGDELYLHVSDEDNQSLLVCGLVLSHSTSTFYIDRVSGYHQGLTRMQDTDRINATMLKLDADARAGRKGGTSGREWGVLSTRINCVHVVSAMLRTLRLGWKVRFLPGPVPPSEGTDFSNELLTTLLDALMRY